MKKSSVLELVYSQHMRKNVLMMHPNIGFDLGLMTKTHTVALCTDIGAKEFLQGADDQGMNVQIDLCNECPQAQVHMHAQYHKFWGDKTKAVLFFDGRRIFIHTL